MLDRLVGLETEYAIRATPRAGHIDPPDNKTASALIMDAVGERLRTLPGRVRLGRARRFLENGGSLYYEYLPTEPGGGLLEAATPECRGPAQLLLYQKAQERLLTEVLPAAGDEAHADLGLLRHCRDADGNIFGVQENYEADIARGPRLWLWRLALVVFMPLAVVNLAVLAALLPILIVGMLLVLLVVVPLAATSERLRPLLDIDEGALGRFDMWLEMGVLWPMLATFGVLTQRLAFRRIRRESEAFFVSRVVLAGTGVVLPDGHFGLSGRAPAIRRRVRVGARPDDRGIFDPMNLAKRLMQPLLLDWRAPFGLFRRRQRLQLGLSESARCQLGEYLAVGSAMLVLDAIESGGLTGAPRLRAPVDALHAFAADPGLSARAEVGDGARTALEIQRWYLEAVERWLQAHPTPSLEARELVRTWGEVLDLLETQPGALVGRIDWVTKRYLLETAGAGADQAVLQKIDLRYHELGEGYLSRLEAAGIAPRLVADEEVARAMVEPPRDTPAAVRGRVVRSLSGGPEPASVDWDSVRIGGTLRGKVVRLADYR